jgi:hypothetical protein
VPSLLFERKYLVHPQPQRIGHLLQPLGGHNTAILISASPSPASVICVSRH